MASAGRGLRRVDADGGNAVEFTKPGSNGEVDRHSPFPLPTAATCWSRCTTRTTEFSIAVQPIDGDTAQDHRRVPASHQHIYRPAIWCLAGEARSSLRRLMPLAWRSPDLAVALVERVDNEPPSGISEYRLSSSGALAYIPQRPRSGRTLTWMTSDGKATPIAVPAGAFDAPRVSPDGTRSRTCLERRMAGVRSGSMSLRRDAACR